MDFFLGNPSKKKIHLNQTLNLPNTTERFKYFFQSVHFSLVQNIRVGKYAANFDVERWRFKIRAT